jgi:hypothetical protein
MRITGTSEWKKIHMLYFQEYFRTIFYKFVSWSIRESCGMSSIEISLRVI